MQHSSTQSIYLSKRERIGLITLISLLSIGLMLPFFIHQFNKTNKSNTIPIIEIPLKNDSILENKIKLTKHNSKSHKKIQVNENTSIQVNPNVMNLPQALSIGMPVKNFKTLQKYLSTGAKIKSPNDLKKIYGLKESTFNRIVSHIYIPKDSIIKNESLKNNDFSKLKKELNSIEINSANIEDYKSLPGIGDKLAERIIKFRNGLGGFINTSQIKEVYGINDSIYNKIHPLITCTPVIIKIKINSSDKDELSAHPYINYKQAEFILQFRRQNGPIKNFNELSQTNFFTEEWLKKIQDYLDFQ